MERRVKVGQEITVNKETVRVKKEVKVKAAKIDLLKIILLTNSFDLIKPYNLQIVGRRNLKLRMQLTRK